MENPIKLSHSPHEAIRRYSRHRFCFLIDPFRQDQWRSASTDSVQHVLDNEGIAGFVVSQCIVNFVNGRLVRLRGKPKSCRTREDKMPKGPGGSLFTGVNPPHSG